MSALTDDAQPAAYWAAQYQVARARWLMAARERKPVEPMRGQAIQAADMLALAVLSQASTSSAVERMTKPELIANTACPECGAEVGASCVRERGGARSSQHGARWRAAGQTIPSGY